MEVWAGGATYSEARNIVMMNDYRRTDLRSILVLKTVTLPAWSVLVRVAASMWRKSKARQCRLAHDDEGGKGAVCC
jgi:hypothetical protein